MKLHDIIGIYIERVVHNLTLCSIYIAVLLYIYIKHFAIDLFMSLLKYLGLRIMPKGKFFQYYCSITTHGILGIILQECFYIHTIMTMYFTTLLYSEKLKLFALILFGLLIHFRKLIGENLYITRVKRG